MWGQTFNLAISFEMQVEKQQGINVSGVALEMNPFADAFIKKPIEMLLQPLKRMRWKFLKHFLCFAEDVK